MAKPKENQILLEELVAQRTHLIQQRTHLIQQRTAEKNRLDESLPKLVQRQNAKLQRLLSQQIEDLDKAIAKLVASDDQWNGKAHLLTSVPGVGATTAHALLSDLPELGDLNRSAIAKLAGVAPLNCDSGRHKGKRRIKGGRTSGRTSGRTATYMAAFSAMSCNPPIRAFAQRLKAAGKAHNVIVTACIRKLLNILNQTLKTNTPWNPNHAS